MHATQWARLHEAYPTAKDISAQLPGWSTEPPTAPTLGWLADGGPDHKGAHYVGLDTESSAPKLYAASAQSSFPLKSIAAFDANKAGARAATTTLAHIDGELWSTADSRLLVRRGHLPGAMHRTVIEGPRGQNLLAVYGGDAAVELTLIAMVEGHLAPVLHRTVLAQSMGPRSCDGDADAGGPAACTWVAPPPQLLKADATGVELLVWSLDPNKPQCDTTRLSCPFIQQAYVYSASSRRFEPTGESVRANKPLFRVHQPQNTAPSRWAGRYTFDWSGGPGVAGGIGHFREYTIEVTGGDEDVRVTLTEEGTQTMGASFESHGVTTAEGLVITLDRCRSDGATECDRFHPGDVVATLTKANRLRFGAMSAPDGKLKELQGKKLP